MRYFKQIIVWLVIAAAAGWSLYDWIFVDNGPAYFTSDWRRIFILALLSIGGGLATLIFMKLPMVTRQRLTTALFAAGAVLVTWCCGYFVWQFVRLRSVLGDTGVLWVFTLMGIGSVTLLAFVWFSFWRYCQRSYGHKSDTMRCG